MKHHKTNHREHTFSLPDLCSCNATASSQQHMSTMLETRGMDRRGQSIQREKKFWHPSTHPYKVCLRLRSVTHRYKGGLCCKTRVFGGTNLISLRFPLQAGLSRVTISHSTTPKLKMSALLVTRPVNRPQENPQLHTYKTLEQGPVSKVDLCL